MEKKRTTDKKECTLLYNGPKLKTGQCGTAFIKSMHMRSVLAFEPINDSQRKIRLKGRFRNMSMISRCV